MAKVWVQELGGQPKEKNVGTVRELLSTMGVSSDRSVTVNGKSATLDDTLNEGAFVAIGEKVKGGA